MSIQQVVGSIAKSLLLIFLSSPTCSAQTLPTNKISIDIGGGLNSIISNAEHEQLSTHAQFAITNQIQHKKHFFSQFSLGLLRVQQAPFHSIFFDPKYQENIHFQSSFQQTHASACILAGLHYKIISFGIGATFKWLLASNLNMEPIGVYSSTTQAAINSTYKKTDFTDTAPFNDFNYAPTFRIELPVYKHISLAYQFAYDLEINPKYYYINNYNTFYHSFLLHFK